MNNTITPTTTDEAIVAGIYASPDFVVFETREEIAAFFGEDEVQEEATPVKGDKITDTITRGWIDRLKMHARGRVTVSNKVSLHAGDTTYIWDTSTNVPRELAPKGVYEMTATVKWVKERKGHTLIGVTRAKFNN